VKHVSTTAWVVTAVIVVAIVVIAALLWTSARRRNLQQRFGPEYERQVARHGDRGAAERELREREQRHAELEIRELSDAERQHYVQQWHHVQAGFVEDPSQAVNAADGLLTSIMSDLGYPTGDFEEQASTLSVEHSRTIGRYRLAHEISLANERHEASTEQLRQALVHYRSLAEELLGTETADTNVDADQPSEQRNLS
jgi:sRNA-binding protein